MFAENFLHVQERCAQDVVLDDPGFVFFDEVSYEMVGGGNSANNL